jgi:hypothetical protein
MSEHNRQTSISSEPKYIANNNWSGRKRVYFKTSSSKKIFNFQWTFLPGKRENTVDLHAGRNEIKAFAEDPTQLVLKIRNLDANATTPHTDATYNVLVVNYNETLVRRDLNNDEYYWDCSLSLREV